MLILKNFRSTTKILPLKISPFKVIDQLYGHARNISIKNIYFEIFFRIQVLVIITFQFLNPTSFTSTPLQFFNILKTSFYKYLAKNQNQNYANQENIQLSACLLFNNVVYMNNFGDKPC